MKYMLILSSLFMVACGAKLTSKNVKKGDCSIVEMSDGAAVTCGDTTTFIPNGQDGSDGSNGSDGQDGTDGTITKIIDPCGKETTHDEVVLQLVDGAFLAWFKNVGLVILNEGTTYQTTDGTKCKFKITNGELNDNNY